MHHFKMQAHACVMLWIWVKLNDFTSQIYFVQLQMVILLAVVRYKLITD